MKTLYDERRRREIHDRLRRLTPATVPQWGKFDAPKMVVHCADAIQMALGRLPTTPKNLVIRRAPLKQLLVYWMPWPKGVPTARELLPGRPVNWGPERELLRQYMQSYPELESRASWPEHPAFGNMTTRAWGVLGYRHTDHHFRQFGI